MKVLLIHIIKIRMKNSPEINKLKKLSISHSSISLIEIIIKKIYQNIGICTRKEWKEIKFGLYLLFY